jgi:multimeric flavodoxin WrbA
MGNSVLILNGSPRKHGNTAFLIGKAAEGIREAHPNASVEVMNLNSLKINPCRACDACRREDRKEPYCAVHDDMAGLYPKVVQADAIVFANPIYWFSVPAQTKLFLDRLYGLWHEKTHVLEGKTFALITVYGDSDPYISGAINTFHMLQDICRYTNSRLGGIVYGTANDIGDAEKDTELTKKAFLLGKTLL